MTSDELSGLLTLNEARASAGDRTAALVVRLVGAYRRLVEDDHASAVRELRKDDLIRGLCDRVESQSELLRKRAEK